MKGIIPILTGTLALACVVLLTPWLKFSSDENVNFFIILILALAVFEMAKFAASKVCDVTDLK